MPQKMATPFSLRRDERVCRKMGVVIKGSSMAHESGTPEPPGDFSLRNVVHDRPAWARWFPRDASASLFCAAGISALVGIADILLCTTVAGDYGLTLFIGTPCVLGIGAPLLHGIGAPRSFWQCVLAAMVCQCALFMGMLVFGIEGIVCIAMAAPLWMSVAIVGASIAYPLHRWMWRGHMFRAGFPVAGLLLVLLIPMAGGAEHVARLQPAMIELTSTVEIDAPPEVVWRRLVEFPAMDRPTQWPFELGIAYPVRADLVGRGVGARRYCVFSTGSAAENIRTWDEPRELAFDVLNTPEPMTEWTLYPGIHPPHLDGYLESKEARFELIALPGNRTRLVGTSWYTNRMFPGAYWRLWSDAIIHQVHVAVFAHVKALAEADFRGGGTGR